MAVKCTRFDVREAEKEYHRHIGTHKCRTGYDKCPERLALWEAIMQTALNWNVEA